MKVLHLSGDWEDVGGILSVIRNLQSASVPWGWQHTVWVHDSYVELRQPALSYRFSRHVCADILNHFAMLARSVRALFELRQLLAKEHFDVIHAHTRGTVFVAFGVARFLRQPVLFTNHSYASRTNMYARFTETKKFHTVVLTPNMLRHYGLREEFPKTGIIPDCCADHFFTQPLIERQTLTPEHTLRVVGVGNIMRWKNWHLIAKGLLCLSESERQRIDFSLWGPRPSDADSVRYDQELRALVTASGLNQQMRFRGVSHRISDVLREADWFLLPSTNEPCSVAITEAMALGLPVLASASGGNIDLIRSGETGLLFEPNNPADLAAKLRLLLNNQCAVISPEQIRESARHRSASAVAADYRKIYEYLAARS